MVCKRCKEEVNLITTDGICMQCVVLKTNQMQFDLQSERIKSLEHILRELVLLFEPWADTRYVPPTNDVIDFIDKAKLLLGENAKETD